MDELAKSIPLPFSEIFTRTVSGDTARYEFAEGIVELTVGAIESTSTIRSVAGDEFDVKPGRAVSEVAVVDGVRIRLGVRRGVDLAARARLRASDRQILENDFVRDFIEVLRRQGLLAQFTRMESVPSRSHDGVPESR